MPDKDSAEYLILKSLNTYQLDTEMLTHTIDRPQPEIKAIIRKLFAEGFIDRLSSSIWFIVFPEFRSKKYRDCPPSSSEFLTTTRVGYLKTKPIITIIKKT
jgi:hypothetical protein